MHQNYRSIFTILFKQQKFLYKHKSPFLLLFIYLIANKFLKLVKNNLKKNSSNSDKQEREMISQKKFFSKFFSKLTKIQTCKRDLAINLNTSLTIAKISKKFLKLKFTSISNAIGNISLHSKFLSKSHPQSQFERLIFSKIWVHVQLFLLTF